VRTISPIRFIFLNRPGISFLLGALVAVAVALGITSSVLDRRWMRAIKVLSKAKLPDLVVIKKTGPQPISIDLTLHDHETEERIASLDYVAQASSWFEIRAWHKSCEQTYGIDQAVASGLRDWLEPGSATNLGPDDIWVAGPQTLLGETLQYGAQTFKVTGKIIELGTTDFDRGSVCIVEQQTFIRIMKGAVPPFSTFYSYYEVWLKEEAKDRTLVLEAIHRLNAQLGREYLVSSYLGAAPQPWYPEFIVVLTILKVFSILLWPAVAYCFMIGFARILSFADSESGSPPALLAAPSRSSAAKAIIITMAGGFAGVWMAMTFSMILLPALLSRILGIPWEDAHLLGHYSTLEPPDFIHASFVIIPISLLFAISGATIAAWRSAKATADPF
jgi:hypothetical protein